ncbi:MAG: hypothetical protein ACYC6Y_05825 [Thermoguttaceae bacterium]
MNRRDFLASGAAGAVLAASLSVASDREAPARPTAPPTGNGLASPNQAKLRVKPVMTDIIHSDIWEGSCRWNAVSPAEEARIANERFASWSKELRAKGLAGAGEVDILDPVHITFSEDFVIAPGEMNKLAPDSQATDAFFVFPSGSSISAFEIGNHFGKPILLKGLGCRNVDIAAYTRSRGNEAFVAADDADLAGIVSLLRARKVLRETRVLFPTDRGLPASCSVGSIWDLAGMERRLGVAVEAISYKELSDEMKRVQADPEATAQAQEHAGELVRGADKCYLEQAYVVKSFQFYQTVRNLMARHNCNAFTIECFELCSSRLPDEWQVTPCLIHGLLKDLGHAASCEGDLGSLLAVRMLMSVSGKSCHQGNSDPKGEGTFRINHSNPALKMNGFDRPDLPYQLGRFVSKGWGTKFAVDFMNNDVKTVTVARVDPTASRLLVLRGQLTGASGWGQDLIGCSVEALIQPPPGRLDEFLRKRLDYGNHLQWVYGDYSEQLRQLGEMLKLDVDVIA